MGSAWCLWTGLSRMIVAERRCAPMGVRRLMVMDFVSFFVLERAAYGLSVGACSYGITAGSRVRLGQSFPGSVFRPQARCTELVRQTDTAPVCFVFVVLGSF